MILNNAGPRTVLLNLWCDVDTVACVQQEAQ